MQAGRDYLHVIQTRFNLATPGRERVLRGKDGWLERRFDLFEQHCLPAIASQTAREFTWVIYFDDQTPENFRERIERCRAVFPFIPYFTGPFGAEGWRQSIHALFPKRPARLVTTRVDNDDGLAIDYVARVQAAVAAMAPTGPMAFNFTNGFILQGGRVYAHSHPCNAFFTWFEPDDETTRTALSIRHMDLAEAGPVMQIGDAGAWLQVVHEINVSNKVRGRRVLADEALDRFPASVLGPLQPVSPVAVHLENLLVGPLRVLRDLLLGIYHRLKRVQKALINSKS